MDAMREHSGRTVVAGVQPEQPLWVVQVAGEYAKAFGAELVCVSVDPARYAFQELPDGTMLTAPLDPDLLAGVPGFPEGQRAAIDALLSPLGVTWSLQERTGGPAEALRQVAEEVDALMIVVGAARGGVRGALRTVLAGSVAGRLAHRQYRPVVVVPTAPDDADDGVEQPA